MNCSFNFCHVAKQDKRSEQRFTAILRNEAEEFWVKITGYKASF